MTKPICTSPTLIWASNPLVVADKADIPQRAGVFTEEVFHHPLLQKQDKHCRHQLQHICSITAALLIHDNWLHQTQANVPKGISTVFASRERQQHLVHTNNYPDATRLFNDNWWQASLPAPPIVAPLTTVLRDTFLVGEHQQSILVAPAEHRTLHQQLWSRRR